MRTDGRVAIQFCGFGGQGVVLASIIFGTAAAIGAGLNAVQTQSYGSEARGGECQAELILDSEPIDSPLADQVDILVAMSQMALNRYLPRLKPSGMLVLGPDMVTRCNRSDVQVFQVPAVRVAGELGATIAANIVMLGFLQGVTGLVSSAALIAAMRDNVPPRYLDLNLRAAERGMALAEESARREPGS